MGVGALSFEAAFAAADTQVLWLIVLAFLLAKVGAWGWWGWGSTGHMGRLALGQGRRCL
jgi:hypothetical protein